MADAPGEGASPCVADGQGLGRGIAAPLLGREGQTGRAYSNGRWDGCGRDGEGDGDGDRGGPGRVQCDDAIMGAGRQGAGGAASCARVSSVSQPGGVMTDVPAQRAAPRVADGQGLGWIESRSN